jgi:hypothetical protein
MVFSIVFSEKFSTNSNLKGAAKSEAVQNPYGPDLRSKRKAEASSIR